MKGLPLMPEKEKKLQWAPPRRGISDSMFSSKGTAKKPKGAASDLPIEQIEG